MKEEYLEGVEAEKMIEEIWSSELEENNDLSDKIEIPELIHQG